MTRQEQHPSQDDRIMAALAHASAILPLMGVVAPIVIWVTQKDKSQYVAFQALQAVAFQLSMVFAWFIGMGCYMLSFFGMFISFTLLSSTGRDNPSFAPLFGGFFFVPIGILLLMFVGGFLFVIYGLVGTVSTLRGRDFRYWLIANRVENFMQPK